MPDFDPIIASTIATAGQVSRDILEIGKQAGSETLALAKEVTAYIDHETRELAAGRREPKAYAETIRTYFDAMQWGSARIAKAAARAAMRRAFIGAAQMLIGAVTGLRGLLAANLPN